MNTNDIVMAIDAEIAQLQKVKALLTETGVPSKRKPGRPAGSPTKAITVAAKPAKRRKMSAEGRAKIAAAQKARWASYKKTAKTAAPSTTPAPAKSVVVSKPIPRKASAKKAKKKVASSKVVL